MAASVSVRDDREDRREGEGAGRAGEGRRADPPPGPDRMATPVTRHAQITGPQDWKVLACGIDSLDVGFYVDMGRTWADLMASLGAGKLAARDTDGILWHWREARVFVIRPKGMGRYTFHLELPEFHMGIVEGPGPIQGPNVLGSIRSESLWRQGVQGAVDQVTQFVGELKGGVTEVKVNRVDICVDFVIPSGLSLDFLRESTVCRSRKRRHYIDGDSLETFYVGSGGSPVQCRIYDKAKEVMKDGMKLWFLEIWGLEHCWNVWRVEFQLRRAALRQYRIESVADLLGGVGGIWRDLTENWLCVRLPDDSNTSRRSVHPWWAAVQACADDLGPAVAMKRDFAAQSAISVEWFKSHIGGCLLSYAARLGVRNFESGLQCLCDDLRAYWRRRDFEEEWRVKSVQLGLPPL